MEQGEPGRKERSACAVVLAGGLGERFGGPKAFATFRGEPLVARAVRRLRTLGFAQVLVSLREPLHVDGAGVVLDGTAARSPLAGLVAAFRAAGFRRVYACAADMPFAADPALVDALFARMDDSVAAVIPSHEGALQPLAGLWSAPACLPEAERLIGRADGSAGPRALALAVRAVQLEWSDPRPFLDADTPEDLRALEAMPRAGD